MFQWNYYRMCSTASGHAEFIEVFQNSSGKYMSVVFQNSSVACIALLLDIAFTIQWKYKVIDIIVFQSVRVLNSKIALGNVT